MVASRRQAFSAISPLPNPHDRALILRHYVQSSPHLFDRSSMAKQNLSHGDNVVSDGSLLRIFVVVEEKYRKPLKIHAFLIIDNLHQERQGLPISAKTFKWQR